MVIPEIMNLVFDLGRAYFATLNEHGWLPRVLHDSDQSLGLWLTITLAYLSLSYPTEHQSRVHMTSKTSDWYGKLSTNE